MKQFFQFVKITIIGGILFLVPVIVLVVVLGKALQLSLKLAMPLSKFVPVDNVFGLAVNNLVAIVIIGILCFLAGILARNAMLSRAVAKAETKFLWRVPGYAFVKGFTDSIGDDKLDSAMRPAILRLDDSTQVVFETEKLSNGKSVVYVPGAPNPWSGSVLIVDQERIDYVPVSMAEAIKPFSMLGKGTDGLVAKMRGDAETERPLKNAFKDIDL
ncbi:DUF502 domain-containing protein [candidate division KSB1 bacterium]|nr:DUF502 domain-containing protein [candidate division KSB1 bacterium]